MKNIHLTLVLFLSTLQGISQFNKSPEHYLSKYSDTVITGNKTTGLSPSTAIFLDKLSREKSGDFRAIFDEYQIINKDQKDYAKIFLIADQHSSLKTHGFIESGNFGRIRTGLIEINKILDLVNSSKVQYIEIATKVKPLLNNAITSSNVDKVYSGLNLPQGYTGDGVVVGIIDGGFDYTHPTFYDSTGTTYRVKRVWEQNATIGSPPTGYTYGRELATLGAILSAQTDDPSSHGTHVAGTAAGSGVGTNNSYRGVAFESDLVLVSVSNNLGIAEGVDYIIKYANSVNKPCVINMSLGTHLGPHDGMSALDQIFDSLSGSGKILVGAAGNEGSIPLYIGKSYSGNDTLMVSFMDFPQSSLGTNGVGLIDIWGEPNDNFTVAVNIYNTNTNQIEDYTPYISSSANGSFNYTIQDNDIFADDCIVNIATEISPLNNKPHITINVDHTDQDDNYRWVLIEIIGHNTSTKMWCHEDANFTSNGYALPFTNGSTSSTVGEIGGTGKSVITVGAYTTTNSYTNFNGSQQTIPFNATLEDLAPFSSHGPTADNRTKPDITAPGNVIIAPVNSFDPNYSTSNPEVVFGVTNGTKNWYYGALQGTSMSSPMVAGILALWLEANPNLSPTNIRNILQSHSRTDTYTGSIPPSGDNTWGWGKIDALAGLVNIVGLDESVLNNSSLQVYPNPAKDIVHIDILELSNVTLRITDLSGRVIKDDIELMNGTNPVNLSELSNGIYLMRFEHQREVYSRKLIISK